MNPIFTRGFSSCSLSTRMSCTSQFKSAPRRDLSGEAGVLFGEGASSLGLAPLFEVHGERGLVGPRHLVVVAFLAAEHLCVVVCGGEERVELERVLAMRTV